MILEGTYTVHDMQSVPYGVALCRLYDKRRSIHVCKPIYQQEPEYFARCEKLVEDLELHEYRYAPDYGLIAFHKDQVGSTVEVWIDGEFQSGQDISQS